MDVQAIPVPALVDLVNGWGTVPRARGGARERPSIPEFIDRHEVPDALRPRFADTPLERLADQLYAVFAAAGADDKARLVSELLTASGVRPGLASDGIRIAPAWRVGRERDALAAAAAVTLHAQLAGHEPERLGTCASGSCGDVYVDASPGAHRRFCSITCQNRERVAAFRRRRSG